MGFTKKQKLHKFMATTHKWIGLIVGVQVVLWTMGGVVMSWMPIEEVRSEHKIAQSNPVVLNSFPTMLSVGELGKLARVPIVQLSYDTLLGKPVARIMFETGGYEIRSALTGELITPISLELAQKIAETDYAPDFPVSEVIKMTENNIDYRGSLPVWRINFADGEATSIYVSPTQARIVARRSSNWRLFDFFWMLHIMDYEERHDFNNPLLIIFSISALAFAISGVFLLFFRFYRRDFSFILDRKVR